MHQEQEKIRLAWIPRSKLRTPQRRLFQQWMLDRHMSVWRRSLPTRGGGGGKRRRRRRRRTNGDQECLEKFGLTGSHINTLSIAYTRTHEGNCSKPPFRDEPLKICRWIAGYPPRIFHETLSPRFPLLLPNPPLPLHVANSPAPRYLSCGELLRAKRCLQILPSTWRRQCVHATRQ